MAAPHASFADRFPRTASRGRTTTEENTYNGSLASEGPESDSGEFQRGVRDNIRKDCRQKLEECARDSNSALSLSNVAEIERAGFSEEALAFAVTEEKKTDALLEWLEKFIPELIGDAKAAGSTIDEAERNHWILKSSADAWRKKMKMGSWTEKRAFVTGKDVSPQAHTLRAFRKNWERIAHDAKAVKELEMKLRLTPEELQSIPPLRALHAPSFRDGSLSYADRRTIVDAALKYLRARLSKQAAGEPLAQSITSLQKRIQEKMKAVDAVPEIRSTIRSHVERTFKNKEKANTADDYQSFLREVLSEWPRIQQFAQLEERRKKEGTRPNFKFVQFSVFFFDWSNGQQQTYLQEGERSFIDVLKTKGIVLKIRHELSAEDWDEAEALISEAKLVKNLTEEDRADIRSMEAYLHEHSGGKRRFNSKEQPDPATIYGRMHQALRGISSASVRRRYELACSYDYQTAWAYMTQVYNWKWCRLHGYSTDEVDEGFRRRAKAETYQHLKHGQPRGYANNDFSGDTSRQPAARSEHGTRSPSVTNIDASTDNDALIKFVHRNNDNRSVWYWNRFVTKNFTYNQTLHVIDNIHPVLKWGMRELKKLNLPFRTEAELKQSSPAIAA